MPVEGNELMGFDFPDFLDIVAAQKSVVSLAACCVDAFDMTGEGEAQSSPFKDRDARCSVTGTDASQQG